MNPTDQARKEARRRELKKNKKQRILVRNAVLKGKRPQEIIEELEKIDDMEYNPVTPCPLNQKVMSEKRRKLMETWDRVYEMYQKDAPDQFDDVKKHWSEYQNRKMDVIRYYESVMAAKDVIIDAIPLPNMSEVEGGDWEEDEDIPLPPVVQPAKSSLKRNIPVMDQQAKMCPGVPPGPPPSFQDYEDLTEPSVESRKRKIRFGVEEEQDDEEEDLVAPGSEPEPKKAPKPNSLQRKMLEMAGQDLDSFMKEMEEVHKEKERVKERDLQKRLARLERDQPQPPGTGQDEFGRSADLRPGQAPPGVNLPHGAPPSQQQQQHQPVRPGVPPQGVRMPPGPPPGVPPQGMQQQQQQQGQQQQGGIRPLMPKPLGVLSAKPQINKSEIKTDKVIASAPVMRNLKSDVTRFVPTHLRVKRGGEDKNKKKRDEDGQKPAMFVQQKAKPKEKSTDDTYNEFMKEMQGLL